MSTYLVAMLVGDFVVPQRRPTAFRSASARCRTSCRADEVRAGGAEAELKFFNEYYGIKYPFGKLDIIAFPDFAAGAMENAGAITFREPRCSPIPSAPRSATRRKTSPRDLARDRAPVVRRPRDDEVVGRHLAERRLRDVDHREADRRVEAGVDADTPAEINQMFDGIAYGKTAAVLRMLESYVGEETFRDGIRAYIKKYAYGNARAEDFWSTMTEVTKQPIDKMMPSFVVQAGAPLVRASAQCEGKETLLTLAQQRMYARRERFLEGSPQLWTIPITVRNLDLPTEAPRRFLLTKKEETFHFDGCSPHLYVNYDGRGFYRSVHAAGMIPPSGNLVTMLSPSERVALVNDSWSLVKIGEENVATQLALFDKLRNEREREVVSAILNQLTAIHNDLVPEAQLPLFRSWVTSYLRPMITELGWTPAAGDSDERKQLRARVISVLGFVAHDALALRKSRELTELALKDPTAVDATLLDTVIGVAAINGDAELLQRMKAARASAKSPGDYYRYLYALIDFEDPALAKEAYAAALSPEMRSQDLPHFVGSMFENPARRAEAWAFVKNNWDELKKKFTPWGGAALVGATGRLCDAKQRQDVQQFFATHPVQASERALRQALEKIDMCVETRTLQTQNLASWLSSQSGGHAIGSAPK
jgi:aminopeptidase N